MVFVYFAPITNVAFSCIIYKAVCVLQTDFVPLLPLTPLLHTPPALHTTGNQHNEVPLCLGTAEKYLRKKRSSPLMG